MSWSFHIASPMRAPDAIAELATVHGASAPPASIRDYIAAGINGLVAKHGEDVLITVSAQGHLCDGPDSYGVTSASIDLRQAE